MLNQPTIWKWGGREQWPLSDIIHKLLTWNGTQKCMSTVSSMAPSLYRWVARKFHTLSMSEASETPQSRKWTLAESLARSWNEKWNQENEKWDISGSDTWFDAHSKPMSWILLLAPSYQCIKEIHSSQATRQLTCGAKIWKQVSLTAQLPTMIRLKLKNAGNLTC